MTVTPLGDIHCVSTPRSASTQLRLVEAPAHSRRPATSARRAKVTSRRRHRAAHWAGDWRLDATARQVGRAGVAAARDALTQAAPEGDLRQAS